MTDWSTVPGVAAASLAAALPAPSITPEQCAAQGGHCFVSEDQVLMSSPPQYPERCRHCGKRRIGVPQEPMRYFDPERQSPAER